MAEEDTLLEQNYPCIRLFITREVNFQDYDHAKIPSKTLIQKCMERFSEDQESGNGNVDKYLIIDAINRMKHDELIRVNKVDGVKLVSLRGDERGSGREWSRNEDEDLRPSQELRLTQDKTIGLSASEHRAKEDIDTVDTHATADDDTDEELDPNRDDSELSVGVHAQLNNVAEKTSAMRHTEAYVEMIRGAIPLIPEIDDHSSPIQTPNRKRKRMNEITASDTGSSMDATSPQRTANSTPRRSNKRFLSEQPDSRRRSGPANMFSPSKRYSPKQEKMDNSPPWLYNLIEKLRLKYPNDSFQADDGDVICLECDGKRFRPYGNSLQNLDTHLRSKTHKDKAAKRSGQHNLPPSNLPASTIQFAYKDTREANVPHMQKPLQAFAYNGQRRVSHLREQLFKELEFVDQQKDFEMSRLSLNLKKFEKNTAEQLDKMESSVQASEKKTVDQLKHMSNMVKYSKETTTNELRDMGERVSSFENKISGQLDVMQNCVKTRDKKLYERLDDMTGWLTRSDLRNNDQVKQMRDDFKGFKAQLEERVEQLASMVENVDGEKELLEKVDKRLEESNQLHQDILNEKLEDLEQTNQMNQEALFTKIAELEQANEKLEGLSQKVEELEQVNRKQQNKLTEQIREFKTARQSFEELRTAQQGQIDDLELQYQIQTEELERQRENDRAFKKSIVQNFEEHFEVMNKRLKTFEKESAARAEVIERQNEERFREFERKSSERIKELEKQSSKRIRELERQNERQRQSIHRYDKVIPEIMRDNTSLWEAVQDLQDESDTDDSVSSWATSLGPQREEAELQKS